MAIEYERTTYRTCGTGEAESNLRFTYCTLGKEHVPNQLGTIKQIIIPNRLDDSYYGSDGEQVYLGVWKRLSSGEEIKLGVSRNTVVHTTKTLSVFEFDGIPNDGESIILGLITHPDGHYTETEEDLGGRGHVGDEDGCWVYTRAEKRLQEYTLVDIIFTIEYAVEVPDEPTPDNPDEPEVPDEPTPDNPDEPEVPDEPELRQIRIEEYWPQIVKNTAEFDQIAAAENPEFNKLAECIYRVLKDSFIKSATDYGVSRWEKMLGISPASNATLEDRKAAVIAHLNTNLPYTVPVLRQMLIGLLGEDNFTMKLNNDTATLTIAVSLDTTAAQIAEVESLLDRVLPRNLVTEIDPFPSNLTRLEYIKFKTKSAFWTEFAPSYYSSCEIVANIEESGAFAILFGNESMNVATNFTVALDNTDGSTPNTNVAFDFNGRRRTSALYNKGDWWWKKVTYFTDNTGVYFDGKLMCQAPASEYFQSNDRWAIGTARYGVENGFIGRIYEVIFRENGEIMHHFIPAVDRVGAPCLFDIVGRIPYYNMGSEDAEVPNQSAGAVTTYSLRRPMSYAQMTEHGIRRLHHVPKGYNGTKEEYAAEHGFKILVETPMPEEGYWIPVWHDREDCIELEWVETEPPTEEVIENE